MTAINWEFSTSPSRFIVFCCIRQNSPHCQELKNFLFAFCQKILPFVFICDFFNHNDCPKFLIFGKEFLNPQIPKSNFGDCALILIPPNNTKLILKQKINNLPRLIFGNINVGRQINHCSRKFFGARTAAFLIAYGFGQSIKGINRGTVPIA